MCRISLPLYGCDIKYMMRQMTFIRTSLLSGGATIITMLLGFVLNKVLAIYIGPIGFGLLGQFQNFLAVLQQWATGGVAIGTVKYTAEFRDDIEKKHAFWSMGLRISLVLTCICSIILYFFASQLSVWVLKSVEYAFIFKLTAVVVFFFVWNQFLLSVLNGQKEIKKLLFINIITSIVKLSLVWWLTSWYGIEGALLGLILLQFVIFCISLYLVSNLNWFSWKAFFGSYDALKVRMLLGFTLMAVVGGITLPISQFLVRDYVGETVSWAAAGHIQALWNISNAYLAVLTSILTIYFLPKLSEIESGFLMRNEVFSALKIVFPVLVLSSFFVVFFRKEITLIMYTEDFLDMANLFLWQLVGDTMKGCSFLFSFIMLAKAMTKTFISTQIIFASSFVLLSLFLVKSHGTIGVSEAYALNYTMYFLASIWVFMKKTRN